MEPEKKEATIATKSKEYLMMCLKAPIPEQKLVDYLPKPSDTVPLVVKFSSGCVPLGCFGSTISCLLSKYSWKVYREVEYDPSKCLAHNIASLHDPNLLLDVVLVDHTQYIEIHIDSDISILPPDTCSQLYTTVFGAVEKVFNIMQLDIKISPAVICTCRSTRKHFAEFKKLRGEYFLRCSRTTKPDEKQLLWMGIGANSLPTLP